MKIIITLFFLSCLSVYAQDSSIESIKLKTKYETPCFIIYMKAANIIIPISDLNESIRLIPEQWKTESERLSFIYGGRAKEVLKSISSEQDKSGCNITNLEPYSDAFYFIVRSLESGRASLVLSSGELLDELYIRRSTHYKSTSFYVKKGDYPFYSTPIASPPPLTVGAKP